MYKYLLPCLPHFHSPLRIPSDAAMTCNKVLQEQKKGQCYEEKLQY